jgi:hypothetical protein
MADLNSVQSFSPSNFSVEPVVRRNQQPGANTPLSMLELANTARSMTALQKEQALLQPSIEQGIAQSKKEVMSAEKAGVDLNQHYADLTRSVYGGLLTDPDFINGKSDSMIQKLDKSKEFLHSIGVPEYNKGQAHKDLIALAKENPSQANQFIKNIVQQGTPNATQAAELNKAPTLLNLGNKVQALPTTPYQGVNPNATYATGLAPQVFANQITGAPMVIGGGGGGGNAPMAPQGQVPPQNAPQVSPQNAPQGGVKAPSTPTTQPTMGGENAKQSKGAQLQQLPNESPANFNARVANVQNSLLKAQDQLNNPESEYGSIPTLKTVNKNILDLLKDPSVNTGAVQDYLAKRSNKGLTNPKEQELAKYLEQRIQARTPKSDADAESKKNAFGSFNLSKEALTNLVRQDNAWITQKELQATGVMKNAGSSTNPNFGKVAEFNNKFAQYGNDPELMKYISIIGDNPGKATLDESDIADLQKGFGSLTKDKLQKMELKRKTLLKLVNGEQ